MVVIRIWGLLKPSCLPVYTATSDTQDSMSLLFRLLTKLWICCETPPTKRPARQRAGPWGGCPSAVWVTKWLPGKAVSVQ